MKKLRNVQNKEVPKKFRGAAVVRGLPMNSAKLDKRLEKKALAQFDATQETFLVVENNALEDEDAVIVKCFADEATAVRYARAMANGNVDYRVLRVIAQTLVIATW